MKRQFFTVTVLKYLLLVNQAGVEAQYDDEGLLEEYLSATQNSTISWEDDDSSTPCSLNVPEFSGLGLMIVYFIVFVFSLFGNSVVIYVVYYMRKGRVSTDIYLMHLALSDLLCCLTLPFWAVDKHFGWMFGNLPCKLLSGFQEASVYSGVFLLACISVDRYFAIVRATRVLPSHHLLVKVVCGVVWLVAGALALPVAIKRESTYDDLLEQFVCYENLTNESSEQWRVSIRLLRHTVGFFLPLVVMAVCYSWTVVTLFHTRSQQKHKAMRVILAVVLAFIVCWLPYNVTVLIDTLIRGDTIESPPCETIYRVEVVLNVTQVLAFMHCAVNPVLYAFIGVKFRNQLLLALYKHGFISKRLQMAYKKSSVSSIRSRNTSVNGEF
ncbi:C-X-C chemokine receptor type 1 [Stegastes partitus]|uniref:C-X-C chemokine receptor type 2 n=1 Tax=Stegastes partitus TaxID=144197 RepID=A0A3B4ZWW7_9TELE|nr:PREDICTED: C-X-C chemokine receptor type 1-like [Stegastes partitus]